MSDNGDLGRGVYPRRTDPQTSHDGAADIVKSGRHLTQRQRVLDDLKAHPDGLTSSEVAEITGLEHHQVWRRLSELGRDGLAHALEEARVSRQTGSAQRVWKWGPEPSEPEQLALFDSPRGYHQ